MRVIPDRGIRWVKCVCDDCNGTGKRWPDKYSFNEYLDKEYRGSSLKKFRNGKIFRWALDEYRVWKKTGEIDCPECLGAGVWEEPR